MGSSALSLSRRFNVAAAATFAAWRKRTMMRSVRALEGAKWRSCALAFIAALRSSLGFALTLSAFISNELRRANFVAIPTLELSFKNRHWPTLNKFKIEQKRFQGV